MKNKKDKIAYLVIVLAIIIGSALIYYYGNKPVLPNVSEDGTIKGTYSLEGIIALNKPYLCRFERNDQTSKVSGLVRTDNGKLFAEFRIETELMEAPFSSFIVLRDNQTYTWTSLAPIGYRAPVVKNASRNATPTEQSQIIGTKEEVYYECENWQDVDQTYFDLPEGVVFGEMKN